MLMERLQNYGIEISNKEKKKKGGEENTVGNFDETWEILLISI